MNSNTTAFFVAVLAIVAALSMRSSANDVAKAIREKDEYERRTCVILPSKKGRRLLWRNYLAGYVRAEISPFQGDEKNVASAKPGESSDSDGLEYSGQGELQISQQWSEPNTSENGLLYRSVWALHEKSYTCYVRKGQDTTKKNFKLEATIYRPGVGIPLGVMGVTGCIALSIVICAIAIHHHFVANKLTHWYFRDTPNCNIPPMANRFFKRNVGYYTLEVFLAVGFAFYFGIVDRYEDYAAGFFLVAFGFLAVKGLLAAAFDHGWYNPGEEDAVDTRNGVLAFPVYLGTPLAQVYTSTYCPPALAVFWLISAHLLGYDLEPAPTATLLIGWPLFCAVWYGPALDDFTRCLRKHDFRVFFAKALWEKTSFLAPHENEQFGSFSNRFLRICAYNVLDSDRRALLVLSNLIAIIITVGLYEIPNYVTESDDTRLKIRPDGSAIEGDQIEHPQFPNYVSKRSFWICAGFFLAQIIAHSLLLFVARDVKKRRSMVKYGSLACLVLAAVSLTGITLLSMFHETLLGSPSETALVAGDPTSSRKGQDLAEGAYFWRMQKIGACFLLGPAFLLWMDHRDMSRIREREIEMQSRRIVDKAKKTKTKKRKLCPGQEKKDESPTRRKVGNGSPMRRKSVEKVEGRDDMRKRRKSDFKSGEGGKSPDRDRKVESPAKIFGSKFKDDDGNEMDAIQRELDRIVRTSRVPMVMRFVIILCVLQMTMSDCSLLILLGLLDYCVTVLVDDHIVPELQRQRAKLGTQDAEKENETFYKGEHGTLKLMDIARPLHSVVASKAQRAATNAERTTLDHELKILSQESSYLTRKYRMWRDLLLGRVERAGIDFLMEHMPTEEVELCSRCLIVLNIGRVILACTGCMDISCATLYQAGVATALWSWCT